MRVDNSTAIVTGGASGLGAAVAAALHAAGASVYALDLGEPADPSTRHAHLKVDVTDAAAVAAAVAEVAEQSQPLRFVVNCAGIAPSARIVGRSGRHDPALFAKVVQVNLVGTFNVMSAAAELIAKTEPDTDGQRGVIVNTSSGAAFDGQVGQVAYAASKGGVVGMTLPAARDLAQYGIRVNAIAPGLMDTPMVAGFPAPVRESLAATVPFPHRLGRPQEFAALVLAIIEHDYLNGETLRMDGALRMAPR
jgi:NAD(P)-dependent dehydrogenase (short-subunit alcohol dehydrogenase family)